VTLPIDVVHVPGVDSQNMRRREVPRYYFGLSNINYSVMMSARMFKVHVAIKSAVVVVLLVQS
jgi:hypothetical protein